MARKIKTVCSVPRRLEGKAAWESKIYKNAGVGGSTGFLHGNKKMVGLFVNRGSLTWPSKQFHCHSC